MRRDRRAKILGAFGYGVRLGGILTLGFAALNIGLLVFSTWPGNAWSVARDVVHGAAGVIVGQAFLEIQRIMTGDAS